MKLLKSPIVVIVMGSISFMITMALCWRMPGESGQGGAEEKEIPPSWEYSNPEVDQLVADLKSERELVVLRKHELDELATRLANERAEIEKIMRQVEAKQREFDTNVVRLKEEEIPNLKKLAKMYSNMSPEGATAILKSIEDEQLVRIFALMKETETAPILEGLAKGGEQDVKRAALISERLRVAMTKNPIKKNNP